MRYSALLLFLIVGCNNGEPWHLNQSDKEKKPVSASATAPPTTAVKAQCPPKDLPTKGCEPYVSGADALYAISEPKFSESTVKGMQCIFAIGVDVRECRDWAMEQFRLLGVRLEGTSQYVPTETLGLYKNMTEFLQELKANVGKQAGANSSSKLAAMLEADKKYFAASEMVLRDQALGRSMSCGSFDDYEGVLRAAHSYLPEYVKASLECIYGMGSITAPGIRQNVIYQLESILYEVETNKIGPKVGSLDRRALLVKMISDLREAPL